MLAPPPLLLLVYLLLLLLIGAAGAYIAVSPPPRPPSPAVVLEAATADKNAFRSVDHLADGAPPSRVVLAPDMLRLPTSWPGRCRR